MKRGDEANCEHTNVENLHTHEDIENHNTFNKNERSRRVEEKEANNEKCEEKNKINYEKDTIKIIQDNRPRKIKNDTNTTYA